MDTNRIARNSPAQIRLHRISVRWRSARSYCPAGHKRPPFQSVTVHAQLCQRQARVCDCRRIYCWLGNCLPPPHLLRAAFVPRHSGWTPTSYWTWQLLDFRLSEKGKCWVLFMIKTLCHSSLGDMKNFWSLCVKLLWGLSVCNNQSGIII